MKHAIKNKFAKYGKINKNDLTIIEIYRNLAEKKNKVSEILRFQMGVFSCRVGQKISFEDQIWFVFKSLTTHFDQH